MCFHLFPNPLLKLSIHIMLQTKLQWGQLMPPYLSQRFLTMIWALKESSPTLSTGEDLPPYLARLALC